MTKGLIPSLIAVGAVYAATKSKFVKEKLGLLESMATTKTKKKT